MYPESDNSELELTVSEFVGLHNQVLEYSVPSVTIVGELSSFKVSKNKWVYFNLKDNEATLKFFGTIYQMNGPLEDGMLLKVRGTPRVHPQFGFSITVIAIQLAGEGTIRRAFDILHKKLTVEGLFEPSRKRLLPYPPQSVGIVASKDSAAYADFIKVLSARWGGINIHLINVQVQGEIAPAQVTQAITQFNESAAPPEVLVIIRGGGSLEDLAAFNTEVVTRAVSGSRIPTIVAIGHEVDTSLAELAADVRASTPSNAAELLVPDRKTTLSELRSTQKQMLRDIEAVLVFSAEYLARLRQTVEDSTLRQIENADVYLTHQSNMLALLSPRQILQRGYAIVRGESGRAVRSTRDISDAQTLKIELSDGTIDFNTEKI